MDRILFSVVISLLIYISQSAPQFPAYPDYPYYRADLEPQHPSQSNFPGYLYFQHPFAYEPYSNSFYVYNHLGTGQQKIPDSKSTSDTKPSQSETETAPQTKKNILKSSPIVNYAKTIPDIQYIPIYGRNLDSWSAKEIPVTVIVDENVEKSYNVPYNSYQGPYVRNYVEQPKPSSDSSSSNQGSVIVKTTANEGHNINVHETPIEQTKFIQGGAPILPNVASISTPQASIVFYPTLYQGSEYGGLGRDLGNFNVNEVPISALVVDEGIADKKSEKEIKSTEGKIDPASSSISSKTRVN